MNFLVNRKVLIFMLFTGLVMLGVISYRRLSLELFPNTSYPAFFLRVAGQSEMSPEQMERAAIIPVEGAVGTLEGVK